MAEMNRVSRFFVNTLKARPNSRLYRWLQANLALPAGAACLEVGGGNGNMAARIVDGLAPARYVATDLDPRQLEAARGYLAERYPQGVPSGLELKAADMLALNAGEVAEVLDKFETSYFLIDTPGQMELFTFREASRSLIEAFGREDPALGYPNTIFTHDQG